MAARLKSNFASRKAIGRATGKVLLLAGLVAYLLPRGIIPVFTAITCDFPEYFTSAKTLRAGEDLIGGWNPKRESIELAVPPRRSDKAFLMQKVSEALGARVSAAMEVKHLPRLPEQFGQPVRRLLAEGASLESTGLQWIERAGDVGGIDGERSEVEARLHRWTAAVRALITRVDGSELDYQTQRLIIRAFVDMAGRLRRTHEGRLCATVDFPILPNSGRHSTNDALE